MYDEQLGRTIIDPLLKDSIVVLDPLRTIECYCWIEVRDPVIVARAVGA